MRRLRVLSLFVSCCLASCNGLSGPVPLTISGSWEMQVLSSGCDVIPGLLDNNGGVAAQVFSVSQSGLNVSASFIDNGGNQCTITGQYTGDQFRGQMTVDDQATTPRIIELVVEGFARIRGANRQVDGFARVSFDSAGLCNGEIVEFCAKVFADSGQQTIEVCPPVDVVFLMDTSGSMLDEAAALCDAIGGVSGRLIDLGLVRIRVTLLGIVQTSTIIEPGASDQDPPGDEFNCLTDTVYRVVGGDGVNHPAVPGNMPASFTYEDDPGVFVTIHPSVLDPGDDEAEEFWAPATALIAQEFDWLEPEGDDPPTVRVVVPISDESPQTGHGICYSIDTTAIDNATAVAVANGVVVSPIFGSDEDNERDPCIFELAQRIAAGTGGIAIKTDSVVQGTGGGATEEQLAQFIFDIVVAACEGRPVEPPSPPPPPPPPPPTASETLIVFTRFGALATIDPATAGVTEVVGTFTGDPAANVGPISSAVFVAGDLWIGTGGRADCLGCLYSLDPFTGEATFMANNAGVVSGHAGLARGPDDRVFATTGDSDVLARLDTAGIASAVGPYDGQSTGNGLTFTSAGDLYVASGDSLIQLDPDTGAGTTMGTFTLEGFTAAEMTALDAGYAVVSLATSSAGAIYGIVQERGGTGGAEQFRSTYLVTVNGTTLTKVGRTTGFLNVDPTPVTVDGLAFVPTSFLTDN